MRFSKFMGKLSSFKGRKLGQSWFFVLCASAVATEVHVNKALQATANFVHFMRGRCAPIFAHKAPKLSAPERGVNVPVQHAGAFESSGVVY